MWRKIFGVVLTLSMLLAICPATLADGGGEQLNGSESKSGQGWTWDHATRTLSLNGYDDSGFEISDGCTIVLADGTANNLYGRMMVSGDLTIRGGGSLELSEMVSMGNDDVALESGTVTIKGTADTIGITCGAFYMKGGNLNVTGNKNGIQCVKAPGSDTLETAFIMTGGDLNISTTGGACISADRIEISNGKAAFAKENGIGAIVLGKSLTVRNGSLTWSNAGDPEFGNLLGRFDVVTIDNSEVRWLDRSEEGLEGEIRAVHTLNVSGAQEGSYHIDELYQADGSSLFKVLRGTVKPAGAAPSQPTPAPAPVPTQTAYATGYQISVNGAPVSFDAYALKDEKGNDTNYVKLRDVAHVFNGTSAQFEVTWDGSIRITTNSAYTPIGSEMATPFSGDQPCRVSTDAVVLNGQPVNLDAILLTDSAGNGYTYFKLRDLGGALDFSVDWSPETGITIATD